MRQSTLFGNKELEILEQRIANNKSDRSGSWVREIRPKVKEILEVWLPRMKELKRTLIVTKKKKKTKELIEDLGELKKNLETEK